MINFNPYRDWRRLLLAWLAGLVVLFGLGGLVFWFLGWPALNPTELGAGVTKDSLIDQVSLEKLVANLKKRASLLEVRRLSPANLVDPSL